MARSVAERFMTIGPRPTYMHHLGLAGVLDLWGATREDRYLEFYLGATGRAPRFDWRLYELTGDARWRSGVEEAGARFLATVRRDREGAMLDPRGRYTIDCLSGYLWTLIVYGHVLRDGRYFDDAWRQLEIHRGYLEDPETGVWYSRWGHSLHPNRPNPGLWGRGNGWLVGAWGRVMHLWDRTHSSYRPALALWQNYARANAAFQAGSGLFRQLLNRPDCFEDATVSGLFCGGFAQGVLHRTLPAEFGPIAWRTFCGLRGLVDLAGNIHNVSTYAGGYNYERQYYTCARLNEPHGDGTVIRGCIGLHELMMRRTLETPRPTERPILVTAHQPRCLTVEPVETVGDPAKLVPGLRARVAALREMPREDLLGGTLLGLLHWHDVSGEASALEEAERRYGEWKERMIGPVRWRLAAELARRTGRRDEIPGCRSFVESELARWPRDRRGVALDVAGGYSIEFLGLWLPLLARAGAETGEARFFDEACRQLFGHHRWLEDPLTSLWYSAYGHGAHARRVNPGLWGLGNGYCLAGIADLLECLPREHAAYGDVFCLLRTYVDAAHKYLPVYGGWTQGMDRLDSFFCVAATALLGSACSRALLQGWVKPEYFALGSGGVKHILEMVHAKGRYGFSSRATGGLDSARAYESHRVENDPGTLGYLLSACAWGTRLMKAGLDPDARDKELGAR